MLKKPTIHIIFLLSLLLGGFTIFLFNYTYVSESTGLVRAADIIEVTWPVENVSLFEKQVFTANLSNIDTTKIKVFWEVEGGVVGGELVSNGESEFKSEVDTTNWDWQKDSKYTLRFLVKDDNDQLIASTAMFVYVGDVPNPVAQVDVDVEKPTKEESEIVQTAAVYQPTVNLKPTTVASNLAPSNFAVEWVMSDIKNNQKFIYRIKGYDEEDIVAYWNSEGGHKNLVYKTDSTTPFTAAINIYGWRWKEKGPYTISFTIADKKTSNVIGTKNFDLFWQGEPGNSKIEIINTDSDTPSLAVSPTAVPAPSTTTTITTTNTAPTSTTPVPTPEPASKPVLIKPSIFSQTNNANINTFTKTKLFTPNKPAVLQSLSGLSNQADIKAIKFIISQPSSVWLNGDAYEDDAFIQDILKKAKANNQIPTFVLYNIPNRDCGSYSSGGTDTIEKYKAWIDRLSKNLYLAEAIVIVEPDALAQLNCLPEKDRAGRVEMLKYAVETIEPTSPHVLVYMDAGHPFWVNAEEMAQRLKKVGIATARGFALNVSNYVSTNDNITYGNYLSSLLGGKKYVIDTSRNGKGPSASREWCNPGGRALGEAPAITQGSQGALDATLWIKFPGESDGTCNGGPNAGGFWTQYAIDLHNNR